MSKIHAVIHDPHPQPQIAEANILAAYDAYLEHWEPSDNHPHHWNNSDLLDFIVWAQERSWHLEPKQAQVEDTPILHHVFGNCSDNTILLSFSVHAEQQKWAEVDIHQFISWACEKGIHLQHANTWGVDLSSCLKPCDTSPRGLLSSRAFEQRANLNRMLRTMKQRTSGAKDTFLQNEKEDIFANLVEQDVSLVPMTQNKVILSVSEQMKTEEKLGTGQKKNHPPLPQASPTPTAPPPKPLPCVISPWPLLPPLPPPPPRSPPPMALLSPTVKCSVTSPGKDDYDEVLDDLLNDAISPSLLSFALNLEEQFHALQLAADCAGDDVVDEDDDTADDDDGVFDLQQELANISLPSQTFPFLLPESSIDKEDTACDCVNTFAGSILRGDDAGGCLVKTHQKIVKDEDPTDVKAPTVSIAQQ